MKEDRLAEGLRQLAQTTVDDLNAQGTKAPLEDRLETLKVASTVLFGLEKMAGKTQDDVPVGRSMHDWQREIRGGDAQH